MTDHYAAAERLLDVGEQVVSEIRAVPDGADQHRRRDALGKQVMGIWAQAQVHATLATVQRPEPSHGNHYRTIPWPPSDELVERVAKVMRDHFYPNSGPYVPRTWREQARAVLDAIGGAGDE